MIRRSYHSFRKKLFDKLAWYLSKNELHNGLEKVLDEVELIHEFTEKYIGRGYYASLHSYQITSEIISVGKLVQKTHSRSILEIGTHKGGTLLLWTRSNLKADLVISLDLPGGSYGGGYIKEREKLYKEFTFDRHDTEMHLLRANSHDESSFYAIKNIIKDRSLDFIFIDGDHSYEGVKQDFEMYSKLVNKGIIALHDVAHHDKDFGVDRFWSELKKSYNTQEFIAENSNKGIGVVFIT